MAAPNLERNLCRDNTDYLVNEINERILERTMATGNTDVLISPRPTSTLFTLPLQNVIPPANCEPRIMKYISDPKSSFLPCTTNGTWSKYSSNINTESILRNQVYALQNAPQATYVPNSTSDLYNSTIQKSSNSTAQGLYPNLPTSISEYNMEKPYANANVLNHYSPSVNLGNNLFNNATRQQLKDN